MKELQCVWMCSSFQFLMSKKESLICEFEMDFKKSFCWRSNLSNGDIISVLCKHECYVLWPPPGLKTGVEIDIFWSVIRSEFGRTGRHIPTKEYPPLLGVRRIAHNAPCLPLPLFCTSACACVLWVGKTVICWRNYWCKILRRYQVQIVLFNIEE